MCIFMNSFFFHIHFCSIWWPFLDTVRPNASTINVIAIITITYKIHLRNWWLNPDNSSPDMCKMYFISSILTYSDNPSTYYILDHPVRNFKTDLQKSQKLDITIRILKWCSNLVIVDLNFFIRWSKKSHYSAFRVNILLVLRKLIFWNIGVRLSNLPILTSGSFNLDTTSSRRI